MSEIRDFILTVTASIAIGCFCHIWYLENIHTSQGSGEIIPPVNVTNSPGSFSCTDLNPNYFEWDER
ncbi:MAG: hypothetical protein MUP16_00825 [Sedimentisphaerales bacterium]|nr:hypothetical protein [Sedimentisphaerales bacterium]